MIASIEKLDKFDQNQVSFPRYVQLVKNFFLANGIEEELQKYVFFNSLGRKHYNLLVNLVSPDLPEDKTLDSVIDTQSIFNCTPLSFHTVFIADVRNHMKV